MGSTYNSVAKSIVENSIRSAIYIDDSLSLPFDRSDNVRFNSESKSLYDSFRRNNVNLNFFKFKKGISWIEKERLLFKSQDLIILDWQLENDGKEEQTLKILEKAVLTPSLHFVCIYTKTDPADLEDIIYSIRAFFGKHDGLAYQSWENIKVVFENDGFFDENFITTIKGQLKELVLYDDRKAESFATINELFSQHLQTRFDEFKHTIEGTFRNLEDGYEAIGYAINQVVMNQTPHKVMDVKTFINDKFLFLNHTIILLTNKQQQKPGALFRYFRDAVVKSSGNFLSLLSLEIKNIFRDGSGFIGKEIDTIDEKAFFYHKAQIELPNSFYDFLIDIWKSEMVSVLYKKDGFPKIIDDQILKKYISSKNIKLQLRKYALQENSDNELSKLNYYYNKLQVDRDRDDYLKFGDIFRIVKENSTSKEFLLCITARCDCLYPENIKKRYHFVEGNIIKNKEGLEIGDTGFISFIKNNTGEIICIKWYSNRPFSIYIENRNVLRNPFTANIGYKGKKIEYVDTIKENYAQRIANNAFSNPVRVGVDFAHKKKK
jgi:hypothetical protein